MNDKEVTQPVLSRLMDKGKQHLPALLNRLAKQIKACLLAVFAKPQLVQNARLQPFPLKHQRLAKRQNVKKARGQEIIQLQRVNALDGTGIAAGLPADITAALLQGLDILHGVKKQRFVVRVHDLSSVHSDGDTITPTRTRLNANLCGYGCRSGDMILWRSILDAEECPPMKGTAMLILLEDKIATPVGPLWILCDEQFRLRAVEWEEHSDRMEQLLDIHYHRDGYQRRASDNPGGLSDKLRAYFGGDLAIIDTLPSETAGTSFQREVWKALRAIPCGQVMHYGQLAEQLGRPGAARAVGAANGANPVSIVVPCHRVIGRNGTMTGYAGGVQRKEWLLRHEGYLLL